MGPSGVRDIGGRPRPVWPGQTLRYVGVRLADPEPVDGPPSSAPRRAELWKTDDWAGPAGRARIPENQPAAAPPSLMSSRELPFLLGQLMGHGPADGAGPSLGP